MSVCAEMVMQPGVWNACGSRKEAVRRECFDQGHHTGVQSGGIYKRATGHYMRARK